MIVGARPAGLWRPSTEHRKAFAPWSSTRAASAGRRRRVPSSATTSVSPGRQRSTAGQRAYQQAWVFGANLAVMQRVTDLWRDADGLSVVLSDFGRVHAPGPAVGAVRAVAAWARS